MLNLMVCFAFGVLLLGFQVAAAQTTCYSCQYTATAGKLGYECVTDPAAWTQGATTVQCTVGLDECFTERVVQSEVVYSMRRGCNNERLVDGCENPNGNQETCRQICASEDLCNGDNVDPTTTTSGGTTATTTTADPAAAVHCYSCQYSYHPDPGHDDSCLTDPASHTMISCPTDRTCFVKSQWDIGEAVWRSFNRGCEDLSAFPACTDGGGFIDRVTTCTSNRCNDNIPNPGGEGSCPSPPPGNTGNSIRASAVVVLILLSLWLT